MKYADARAQIKTGDLLFWSHGSWRSWKSIQVVIVRAMTLSEYSHVGVAWVVNGRVFVVHAIGRGVCIEPLSTQGEFYWLPMRTEFSEEALDRAFSRVGDKYSKLQAIMGFLGLLKAGEDRVWQCAEFVVWFYQQVGYALSDCVTPSGIARAAMAHGHTLQLVEQ